MFSWLDETKFYSLFSDYNSKKVDFFFVCFYGMEIYSAIFKSFHYC